MTKKQKERLQVVIVRLESVRTQTRTTEEDTPYLNDAISMLEIYSEDTESYTKLEV